MCANQSFENYLKQATRDSESALDEWWPINDRIPESLSEAMQYSLQAGGKRIRPILMFFAAEACGVSRKKTYPAACAVEWIHTYSLIHDDLPAMDNDDFRRGKPTNHKMYGDAMAILAGDGLLTHAFQLVTELIRVDVNPLTILNIISELSVAAGPMGMVGGQVRDMAGNRNTTTLSMLEKTHEHKTGDLIVFSLRAGAMVGNASHEQLDALTRFGKDIGLAFQILDDVLDEIGDEIKLGKPLKSDEKSEKPTYPFYLGLDVAQEKVRVLTERAKEAIRHAGFTNIEPLCQLADFLLNRDH